MPMKWLTAALAFALSTASVLPAHADPIHDAAREGDVAALSKLLKNDPDSVGAPDPVMGTGSTPLHEAARWGQTEAAKVLLDYKADINAEAVRVGSPLDVAVRARAGQVAELLLSRGAKLDVFTAAGLGRLDDLRRFLKEDPKRLNAPDGGGDAPLDWAVRTGQQAATELLLSQGAKVSAKGRQGATPLYYASWSANIRLAKLLLDHGADLEIKCDVGYTPLHDAASRNDLEMAKLLIARGANVNARQDRPYAPYAEAGGARLWTPLHAAVGSAGVSMVELLAAKADLEARDWAGRTPLYAAALDGKTDLAKALFLAGASLDARDNRLQTPLHAAATFGRADVAELLLDKGADVNARDDREWTPLHYAVDHGDRGMAALLLKRKADVNAAARRRVLDPETGVSKVDSVGGTTPLHVAVSNHQKEIAELLLSHGADVNAKDQGGRTALTDATYGRNEDPEMAGLLRKYGGR